MSWPVKALRGPAVWAVAFCAIYAAHGMGCAWGWPARAALIGDLHRFTLVLLWLVALAAEVAIVAQGPRQASQSDHSSDRLVRAGGWIGLAATLLTLFPVLGLTSCGPAP